VAVSTPPDRVEDHDGQVSYIRTDADLPPVAIVDRSPITIRHKIIFAIIAVIGAIA
jgi:carbon starvation protein